MGTAIGDMLPSAVGVAISPLPIVAVVLMLATDRGKVNGPAFVAGWWLGVGLVGTAVLLISGAAGASREGDPATWVGVLKLVLGALLLLLAVRSWRHRPRPGEAPHMPKWMEALDSFSPIKAAGMALLLSAVNPKNLLLTAAGAAAIAAAGLSTGQQAAALIVFVIIASLGVVAPVATYFALGSRSAMMLGELKEWLSAHNEVIMAVLLLILGAKLIGDGISSLS